jgi:hypothetical protein
VTRLFTDDELRELEKSLPQRALEALEAGNVPLLCHLLLRMSAAHAALHYLGTACLSRIWGKWLRDQGEERTVRMLDRIGRQVMQPYVKQFREGREKETIVDLVGLFKQQYGSRVAPAGHSATEVVFDLSPCGSGGINVLRGFERQMPQWYRRLDNGVPIFCAGCKSLQKAMNDACEREVWSTEISAEVPGNCRLRFGLGPDSDARFSAGELQEVTKTKAQIAAERVAAGNLDVAHLIEDQQYDWGQWHDTLMVWSEYTFAACAEFGGMDYLQDCLREGYDSGFAFLYASMEAFPSDRERVEALAQNWHYHQGAFRIVEEDDRFVFILDPCGSGGRMFREEMTKDRFHYGTDLAPIVREPHPLTFGRTDFPMYCTHCASGNREQFGGKPLIFVVDGHAQLRRGMPCRQYLWKKGSAPVVEERLLRQVSMQRPASRSGGSQQE